jgi:peptide deformylase
MSLLPILEYPDPKLREKCVPANSVDERIRAILNDMAETMYDAPGVGLAAAQVGVKERLIVVDVGSDDEEERTARLYKLVNPEIIEAEGTIEYEEGCLSIPGVKDVVKRSGFVKVRALNEQGITIEIEAEGLLAVCLQHEIDHLDGILFFDHLSRIKRERLLTRLEKQKKET